MRHPENFASQLERPTQPDNVDELSDIMHELRLLRERVTILETSVFGSLPNLVPNVPAGHEQAFHVAEIVHDGADAHITVQRQQGANIAIAIRSPSIQHASICTSGSRPDTAFVTSSSHQPAMFGNPAASPGPPIPTASPPTPIPSQSSSSWGSMMTPREVQELLAPQPQIGEFYVVIKGRRPGVYLSWADAHDLVDGVRSPCHWKKTDKHAALGQYTMAYKKGNCEYRFQ